MKLSNRITKTILGILLIVSVMSITGCSSATGKGEGTTFNSLEDFNGHSAALVTGSVQESEAEKTFSDYQPIYYQAIPDCIMAVNSNKADFTVIPDGSARTIKSGYPDLAIFPQNISEKGVYFGTSKTEFGVQLAGEINEFIAEIRASGHLEEIEEKWYYDDEYAPVFDYSELPDTNGIIVYGAFVQDIPHFCKVGDKFSGIEAEILYEFCEQRGYRLDPQVLEVTSVLAGLSTGKVDIAGYLAYSEERAQQITYTDAYTTGSSIIVVRRENLPSEGEAAITEDKGIFAQLAYALNINFVQEDRWKMMLSGFAVTIELAILSGIFGTILGLLLCLVRRSKGSVPKNVSKVYIRLMQGIPTVVLLLVLYYIIFAKSKISGILVGVVAFSLEFGVYVCEILRSGIESVDQGQWEAASALGLTKRQTMTKVILPQAINTALPVYKGQFIAMVKMTAVVGYVAVEDLTKVSNIIISRTYDAILPMLVTAAIYFLLSWVLTLLIGRIEVMTDPTKRKNVLKGIDTDKEIEGSISNETENNLDEVILEIKHLRKSYAQSTPLKDINAEIRKGDVVSIIGPSGTGKSTLLRCINRLDEPTSGDVFAFGERIESGGEQLRKTRMRIGMVFQSFNLFSNMTVIENIMLAPVLLGKATQQEAYENGIRWLRQVGLERQALQYPSQLSGGQKQRVAIARTMAMNPEVVLFDEPTSALDPTMVGQVLSVIQKLAGQGRTMMIVTHEMEFARTVSNRVMYIDQGEIYEDGAPDVIFENPTRNRTRQFMQRMKVLEKKFGPGEADYPELCSDIETYGYKHGMDRNKALHAVAIFEEMCINTMLPKTDKSEHIHYLLECSDRDNTANVTLIWKGTDENPMDTLSETQKAIVTGCCEEIKFTPGEKNNVLSFFKLK